MGEASTIFDARWLSCTDCRLHKTRRRVVLGRGDPHADIVIVGIGPGVSEDVIGKPFVGPSGRLLARAIDSAAKYVKFRPTLWMDNLVACRPTWDIHGENRDPRSTELISCRPRLVNVVERIRPKRIVLLGQLTWEEGGKLFPDAEKLTHPAYVLRRGGVSTVDYVRFFMALAGVFKRVGECK